MILFVFYAAAGFYFVLAAVGLFRPAFLYRVSGYTERYVRIALFFFGAGLILTASYQAYVYYSFSGMY